MEADSQLRCGVLGVVAGLLSIFVTSSVSNAANKRTQNFIIHAPTPQLAETVGQAAEKYRRELAIHWLGSALPAWPAPCPVRVTAGPNLAAQGVTTYNPAPVRDFQMEVIGTPERILDSVLPHEITHTILATYFGRPLPRWADEGICTTVEHVAERSKHEAKLREFLRTRRGIAMNQLFLMTEYPSDVLPLYAQGYSVCRFLIAQKGPRTFIRFLQDYMRQPSWTVNVKKHYQYDSLAELQRYWLAWVSDGSGDTDQFAKTPNPTPASGGIASNGRPSRLAQASATAPVARPATSGPANGPAERAIGVSSQDTPAIKTGSAISPGASTLASTRAGGWYQRNRQQVIALTRGQSTESPSPTTPPQSPTKTLNLVPPSVRNSGPYQTAHPQAEGPISRSATSGMSGSLGARRFR